MTSSIAVRGELELESQAELLEHLAASPVVEVRREAGLLAVATALQSNTMNGVVCRRLRTDDADGIVADVLAWFEARRVPASWLCPVEARDLRARLIAAGCKEETSGFQIGFELDRFPSSELGGVDVAAVADERDLDEWLDLAEQCGWVEDADERRARAGLKLSLGLGSARQWVDYVARRQGRAVGFASAFFGSRAVLLEALAVPERERRRGIASALVGARLREARRRGFGLAVLGPSPDGAALYRSFGFEPTPVVPGRWFYLPPPERRS